MDFRGGGLKIGLGRSPLFLRQRLLQRLSQGRHLAALGRRRPGRASPRRSIRRIRTNTSTRKRSSTRQIIPVTEIETGLTGHVTCNTSITTGYMFSAWHDLGFRDEFNFPDADGNELRRRQHPGLRRILRPRGSGVLDQSQAVPAESEIARTHLLSLVSLTYTEHQSAGRAGRLKNVRIVSEGPASAWGSALFVLRADHAGHARFANRALE